MSTQRKRYLRPWLLGTGLATLLSLSVGCTAAPPTPSTSPTAPRTSVTTPAQPTVDPTSAPPTVEPTPTATPTTNPWPPDPGDSWDVSAFDQVDFASPTAGLLCGITPTGAACFLPPGFQQKVPSGADACADEYLDVNAVYVDENGAGWGCFNDPAVWPSKGSENVKWHKGTGFGWAKRDGQQFAVLPYGEALFKDGTTCSMAKDGVRCATETGVGFWIRKAGAKFYQG